jgi:hypothetical protein
MAVRPVVWSDGLHGSELVVIDDTMNVLDRIDVRAQLPSRAGLLGDGAIGATALKLKYPVITKDAKFPDVLRSLVLDVRDIRR